MRRRLRRSSTVKPSRVLTVYLAATFGLGVLLCLPLSLSVKAFEIGSRSAALLALCWNVLFLMILPMVFDWSERQHFKARFMEMEELTEQYPEIAVVISEQCKKLSLPGLKLAVVDSPTQELFSYGLWGIKPRLIVTTGLLEADPPAPVRLSIEGEIERFARQDQTMVFLLFTVFQVLLQQLLVVFL